MTEGNMIRTSVIGMALLSLTLCTGCGTFSTRAGSKHFGAPPYGAVVYDVDVVANRQPLAKCLAVANVPFDLVLDTLFLPVDLCFWAAGQEKDGFLGGVE